MIRISWLKKIWNGRSKGISTVLGTVFLTLVIFAISTNVFLWTLSRNAEYTLAVKEENQKTSDRLNEYVIASGTNYSVSEDEIHIKVTLKNAGSLAVQLINLWVFDTAQQKYTNEPVDLSLNPGQAKLWSEAVVISGANKSDDIVAWFVTARGNTVPLQTEEGVVIAQLSQGIGSMALDFYTFRYFKYDNASSNKLTNYPSGTSSFSVPHGTEIALGVVLTNLDPTKQAITLYANSLIWLYFPAVPGHTLGPVWYIVREINGTIQSSYSEVSIEYGETKLIVFASEEAGSFSKVKIVDQQQKDSLGAVNLLLYGKLGNSDYGQNIPFVSMFVPE